MRILKIKGKDEQTVHKQIEKEYGDKAIIISSHKEKPSGVKGWFQKAVVTVTIAIEENTQEVEQQPEEQNTLLPPSTRKEEEVEDHIDLTGVKEAILSEMLLRQLPERNTVQSKYEVNQLHKQEDEKSVDEDPKQDDKSVKQMITRGLLNEGVSLDVVDYVMNNIKETMSIDEVARILYIKLTEELRVDRSVDAYPYIFFIGSTGVGKTTTIAKLTAGYVLNRGKKVALLTSDTYRIAAIDQLKTYAEIIDVPVEVIYEKNDFENSIKKWEDQDYILIDTAGRSHKNITEIEKVKEFFEYVPSKKVFLVLNMSTNYKDAQNIIDVYKEVVGEFSLIFTKLDETDAIGNLINIAIYAKMPIAYVANGQDVPDDIERFEVDAYIKQLLGRISYE